MTANPRRSPSPMTSSMKVYSHILYEKHWTFKYLLPSLHSRIYSYSQSSYPFFQESEKPQSTRSLSIFMMYR